MCNKRLSVGADVGSNFRTSGGVWAAAKFVQPTGPRTVDTRWCDLLLNWALVHNDVSVLTVYKTSQEEKEEEEEAKIGQNSRTVRRRLGASVAGTRDWGLTYIYMSCIYKWCRDMRRRRDADATSRRRRRWQISFFFNTNALFTNRILIAFLKKDLTIQKKYNCIHLNNRKWSVHLVRVYIDTVCWPVGPAAPAVVQI